MLTGGRVSVRSWRDTTGEAAKRLASPQKICTREPDAVTKKDCFWEGNEKMFSHVMIGTNDLDRAKAFYDNLLGTLGVPPGAVDRHRQRQNKRAVRLTHPMGDHFSMVDCRKHRSEQDDQKHNREGVTAGRMAEPDAGQRCRRKK